MKASGQLLSVQTVIRHTKTYPVPLRSLWVTSISFCITDNVRSFSMLSVAAACPFTLDLPFLNIFFFPWESWLTTFQLADMSKLPPFSSLLFHCCLPFFPLSFSHSANAFCGCNEAFQCPLGVGGHNANVWVIECVCLSVCFDREEGLTVYVWQMVLFHWISNLKYNKYE